MRITVFTPSYNRGYIIEKLFQSLRRQKFTDFEWLVVDDGSTDNTESLFQQWTIETKSFPIRYYKKKNGGKYKAINYGLNLAQGELFLTVDSDDYLTDDALELIDLWEKSLRNRNDYCGIAGNMGIRHSIITRSGTYYDGTLLDRYHNINGERLIAFYTDVHRKYKYPEFDDEKFMTEAVAWNRMAHDGCKMRFYDDIICIYEYREDGLTRAGSSLFADNPRGYGLWLSEKSQFLGDTYLKRCKMYYGYVCDLINRYSISQIRSFIDAPGIILEVCYILYKLKNSRRRK